MSRASLFAGLVRRSNVVGQAMAQAYATANLMAEVKITRPGELFDDPDTGRVRRASVTIYEGAARFWPVQGAAIQGMGDEPQYFDSCLISIPLDAATPMIDDVAECIDHKDTRMVGRVFRITGHEAGGQLPAVQRMSATSIAPSKQWVP